MGGGGGLSAVHPGGVNVFFCLGLERCVEDSSSLQRILMRSAAHLSRIVLRLPDSWTLHPHRLPADIQPGEDLHSQTSSGDHQQVVST